MLDLPQFNQDCTMLCIASLSEREAGTGQDGGVGRKAPRWRMYFVSQTKVGTALSEVSRDVWRGENNGRRYG